MEKYREYLGDSVYVEFDGYHIWLTTDNGYGITNKVALDPGVFDRLIDYIKRLYEKID